MVPSFRPLGRGGGASCDVIFASAWRRPAGETMLRAAAARSEDEQEEAPEQPAATKNGYLECSSSSCRAQRLKHGVGSVRDACPPTKIFTLPPRLPPTD